MPAVGHRHSERAASSIVRRQCVCRQPETYVEPSVDAVRERAPENVRPPTEASILELSFLTLAKRKHLTGV